MKTLIKRFAANEAGTTAIEYGLMAALISVVLIATVTNIGTHLNAKFLQIDQAID